MLEPPAFLGIVREFYQIWFVSILKVLIPE
jgi:hypothetical protein